MDCYVSLSVNSNAKTYDKVYTSYLSERCVEWLLKLMWRGVTGRVSKRQLRNMVNEFILRNNHRNQVNVIIEWIVDLKKFIFK